MLISAENLYKNYGDKQLLNGASMYLEEKDKIGIIGINGTGKSTLLKILGGTDTPDKGSVTKQRNNTLAFLSQNPVMDENKTVLEQVLTGNKAEHIGDYEIKAMLSKLGITDLDAKISTLSGGQKKRVALAETLSQKSEILILDEPTNHLDSDMVIWLEERLRRYNGGLIMVTHDRYFLDRIVSKITEVSHGNLYTYEANYSKYLELKAQRQDMEQATERKRQSILRKEYQWIMRGARARGTKSKERIDRYEELKDRSAPVVDGNVEMATLTRRIGKKLIEIEGISKSFGDKTVINNFSYNLKRSDRIGIVGNNGMGKSSLLNVITGKLIPDEGKVEVGETVKIGYFSQEGRELNLKQRVYDFITEISREVETQEGTFSASQILERFLFDSSMQYQEIGKLSGGERRRLYLLSILITAPNILFLDEPTNDLDIETLTILEDYLETFPGPVIAVSHDRFFLDKVADSIFEVGKNGNITIYGGNYSDYMEKRTVDEEVKKEVKVVQKRAPKPQKLKLTFGEQRELSTIDDEIASLEEELEDCTKEIANSSSDYTKLLELTEKQENLKIKLEEKTERWIYLNELVEKIEAEEINKK